MSGTKLEPPVLTLLDTPDSHIHFAGGGNGQIYLVDENDVKVIPGECFSEYRIGKDVALDNLIMNRFINCILDPLISAVEEELKELKSSISIPELLIEVEKRFRSTLKTIDEGGVISLSQNFDYNIYKAYLDLVRIFVGELELEHVSDPRLIAVKGFLRLSETYWKD